MIKVLKWVAEVYRNWRDDRVASLAAALAYYTLFSLAPILLICITIVGSLFGEDAARSQILTQISIVAGEQVSTEIQEVIKNATLPTNSLNVQIISILILLFSATGVFSEIQAGLNIIWGVQPHLSKKRFTVIRSRLLSFAMVLTAALLLLISLIITTLLAALSSHIHYFIGVDIFFELVVSYFISFIIATLLFALMFKHLPDVNLKWNNVWVGALSTSLLFILGKIFIGFYVNHAHITSIFGAAGSLIILLIWVYYSAQIFFLGAEISKIYATKKRDSITPPRNSLP
ncbi:MULTISPECIES: YihY/virulence factor BrkB family protein [Legionella]|uniref:YihY/virulence factor BrkB family protein n=1 Tax=Legionella TaxID=445 RepID=UPI000962C737|nr:MULTISPECIES: YihY/virulence factor BrkB family protein [Legionella]MBN9229109.1 YihY/virulence factor BrkB family protein [Legionella steelei]OJW17035.1 MAG: ribonuclease BN [Legionella sp. 39-23]